jgi:hypothetical protein
MKTTFRLGKTTFRLSDHVKTLKGDRERNLQFKGKIVKFTYWRDYPAAVIKRDNNAKNRSWYSTDYATCLLKNLVIL